MASSNQPHELGTETPKILPIHTHRKVFLVKVPKFVAAQWREQDAGTIVGVVLDPTSNASQANASSEAPQHTGNNLSNRLPGTTSNDSGVAQPSSTSSLGSKSRCVIISSESIASHAARQAAGKEKEASFSGREDVKMTPQCAALQHMRTLSVQSAASKNLHLLARRTQVAQYGSDELGDGTNVADALDDNSYDVLGPDSLFAEQDAAAASVLINSDSGTSTVGEGLSSALENHTARRSSAAHELSIEAQVEETWTLVPQLDATYHTFLKLRNQEALNSSRPTREVRLTAGTPARVQDNNASFLFRYYQPDASGPGGLNDINSQRHRSRVGRSRMAGASRPEPGSAEALEREDALKRRLFNAFEERSSSTEDGTLTLQDILKLSGESYQYVKNVLSHIAEPVRTSERKRLLYKLKPEFRSRH